MKSIVDLLFPQSCLNCGMLLSGQDAHLLCTQCLTALERIPRPICLVCGRPFRVNWDVPRACGKCFDQKIYYAQARSCFLYQRDNITSRLLLQFKYGNRFSVAKLLGKDLVQVYRAHFSDRGIDIILPVPLHWRRRINRGYNQAQLLAREVSLYTGVPLMTRVLIRQLKTMPQKGNAKERSANIRNAFLIRHRERIYRRTVLLIDDVFTTGSTVNECARILLRHGCLKVYVLTAACVSL